MSAVIARLLRRLAVGPELLSPSSCRNGSASISFASASSIARNITHCLWNFAGVSDSTHRSTCIVNANLPAQAFVALHDSKDGPVTAAASPFISLASRRR
jgi:hypothetical protein